MIILETHNRIVEETVAQALASEKKESVDVTCADFDGVSFHISNPADKSLLNISVNTKCFEQLRQCGVEDQIKKRYGPLVVAPETGYNITLQIKTDAKQSDPEIAHKISLLKRHVLGAAFYKVFESVDKKTKIPDLIEIQYRDDEAFYLKCEGDRVIVIFSISFKDADDVIYSKVFLQEFVDARRNMRGAPAVAFSQKVPPLELEGHHVAQGENNGFVSFVLFGDQMTAKNREKTIDNMLMFRDYLHYHIKCSKAYLHTRMRNRVESFLQILNRAKQPIPEENKKAKTITGKAFVRKV
jgi:actin related protein 2/3 complex subunit 2